MRNTEPDLKGLLDELSQQVLAYHGSNLPPYHEDQIQRLIKMIGGARAAQVFLEDETPPLKIERTL